MDSFSRDLFNFAANLSRAAARYDALTPVEPDFPALLDPVPCPDCIGHSGWSSGNHVFRCLRCAGSGEVERESVTQDI
jgi:hypothetical protein